MISECAQAGIHGITRPLAVSPVWRSFKDSVSFKHAFLPQIIGLLSDCVRITMESGYWLLESISSMQKDVEKTHRDEVVGELVGATLNCGMPGMVPGTRLLTLEHFSNLAGGQNGIERLKSARFWLFHQRVSTLQLRVYYSIRHHRAWPSSVVLCVHVTVLQYSWSYHQQI